MLHVCVERRLKHVLRPRLAESTEGDCRTPAWTPRAIPQNHTFGACKQIGIPAKRKAWRKLSDPRAQITFNAYWQDSEPWIAGTQPSAAFQSKARYQDKTLNLHPPQPAPLKPAAEDAFHRPRFDLLPLRGSGAPLGRIAGTAAASATAAGSHRKILLVPGVFLD